MTSNGVGLTSGFVGAVLASSIPALGGAFFGYCYARLENLPVKQATIAWAIWFAVEHIFHTLITISNEEETQRAFIKGIVVFGTTLIAIHELKRRNLIGDLMALCFVALRVFTFYNLISEGNQSLTD